VVYVRVNENKQKINFKLSIIGGWILSIVFSWIGVQTIYSGAITNIPGIFFYPAISILLGFLLICSLGLYYDESSKIWGMFLFMFLFPLILSYFLFLHVLYLDFFLFGLIIGIITSVYYVINHHHEILAKFVKITLKIFTALIMFILLYNFFMFLPNVSIDGFILAYQNNRLGFISYFLNIIIITGIYLLLMKQITGVDASEVFVFGPKKSGKTYFMLGMYYQFIDHFQGHHKEVIFSGVQNENSLRIDYYLGKIIKNEPIEATNQDMVGFYSFMGEKWRFKSFNLTIVDYAGELIDDLPSKIDPDTYKEKIVKLSNNLNINQQVLTEKIGTLEYLESIKKSNREILDPIIEDIVLSFIYRRLTRSGKIILLIDGDTVAKNDGVSRDELTRLFGFYSRIITHIGLEKQYALVVTKTDKIKSIEEISEISEQAKNVEGDIYNYLQTIPTFKAIEGRAGSIPIFFFTVSVNSMNKKDQPTIISQIFPWRFGEVAKFMV